MNCPDQGKLLLYLESELSPEENRHMESHLVSCSRCLHELNELEDNLNFALQCRPEMLGEFQDYEPAGQTAVWKQVQKDMKKAKWRLITMKLKKTAIAAAIVLSIGLVGTVPAVQTVAANFLQVFRVQNVDTLTLGPNDMLQIQNALQQGNQNFDVENFGSIKTLGEQEERSLKADELNTLNFKARFPTLMADQKAEYLLQKSPVIEIQPKVDNINKFLLSLGSAYKLPAALDGQQCRISMGESLITNYDGLSLYQAPSPQIEVPEGVKVEEVAQAMVALPIWPENVKRQLESVSDWEHTLLIPTDGNAVKVTVNGKNAVLAKEDNYRALIWQEDGILYFLEDHANQQVDLVKIAESLR